MPIGSTADGFGPGRLRHLISARGSAAARFWVTAALSLLQIPVLALLYAPDASAWWRWDDTQILKHALEHSIWETFFVPECWQRLSAANLTPWVDLSYELDYALFGSTPLAFYGHQLLAVLLVGLATFFLLAIWLRPAGAFLGSLLFYAGAHTAVVTEQLMTRHYLEGLLGAILSILCYRAALKRRSLPLSCLGGLCYLMAVTAKEIYTPLILVLAVWPEGTWRERLRTLCPYCLVIAAYIPWRFFMLGGLVGGYSHLAGKVAPVDFARRLGSALFGQGWHSALMHGPLVLLMSIGLWRWRRRWLFAIVLLAVLVLPLYPVAALLNEPGRYLFLPWWVLSVLGALTAFARTGPSLKGSLLGLCVFAALLSGSLLHARRQLAVMQPEIQRFETVGRFAWSHSAGSGALYAPTLSRTAWYLSGLFWLKQRQAPAEGSMDVLADPSQLAERDERPVWVYDRAKRRVRRLGRERAEILAAWRTKVRDKPLALELGYDRQNIFSWRFGPYSEGGYTLLTLDRWGVTGKRSLPPSGKAKAILDPRLVFRLKYRSPQGWMAYSPQLRFKPYQEEGVAWSRRAAGGAN